MRFYLLDDKNLFWHRLLLLYLLAAFLTPSVHSHDLQIHQDIALKVGATHGHALPLGIAGLSGDGLRPGDNLGGISRSDGASHQHSHFHRNLLVNPRRAAGGLENHQPVFHQAESSRLAFRYISCQYFRPLPADTPPRGPAFIFAATDLPPPAA